SVAGRIDVGVATRPAFQIIVAPSAKERVVTGSAIQGIITRIAADPCALLDRGSVPNRPVGEPEFLHAIFRTRIELVFYADFLAGSKITDEEIVSRVSQFDIRGHEIR